MIRNAIESLPLEQTSATVVEAWRSSCSILLTQEGPDRLFRIATELS